MQEILDKILPFVWGAWKYRWTVLLCAWISALVGWSAVESMEYRYQARARIFVDTNRVLQPLMQGITVQPDVTARVALMSRALLTRPNIERLVRMTDIDHGVETPEEYEQLLKNLAQRLSLRSGRRDDTIYSVYFSDPDPDIARRAVQALITIFIESNLGDQREDSQSAESFIDNQIAEYEKRLEEAENRLSEFRRDNVGVMPGQSGGHYQRLEESVALLRGARLELREARDRSSELRRQLEQERTLDSTAVVNTAQLTRIQELQGELDDLLIRYTERHPRVSQLREMIADLRTVEAPDASSVNAAPQTRFQDSLVYQNLRSSLSESEARVAELTSRVTSYENEVRELEETVDSIPLVEAELQQLDRDYETIRQQHSQLLEKRESARLSKSLEQDVDDVKFRIIDPPFVPSQPDSPNKVMLSGGVMVASVGFGVGVSLLLSFLRPVFYGDRTLARLTGVTVLGSVSVYESKGVKFRRLMGLFCFMAFSGLLLALCGALLYLHMSGLSVAEIANKEEFRGIMIFFNQVRDSALVQGIINSSLVQTIVNSGVVQKIMDVVEGML